MTTQQPERRATDADREAAADLVQQAVGAGRIDLPEVERRMMLIYSTDTRAQLDALTRDLLPVTHGGDSDTLTIRARGTTQKREGQWTAPPRIEIDAEHASVTLDFSTAVVRHQTIEMALTARHSSVTLLVPEGWRIDLDDIENQWSTTHNKAGQPGADSVLLHVAGLVAHGSLAVRQAGSHRWSRR